MELTDLLGAVRALAEEAGVTMDEVEGLRRERAEQRGAFRQRCAWWRR